MRINRRRISFLALALIALAASSSKADVFDDPTYAPEFELSNVLSSTAMTVAFDGTHYWASRGGTAGINLAQYDVAGNHLASFGGPDIRSVFSDEAGNVYVRNFNNPTIMLQDSPGSLVPFVTLAASTTPLNSQARVVLSGDGSRFVSMNNGVVQEWDLSGSFIGETSLTGWGSVAGETAAISNLAVAAYDDYWFTLANDQLSAWDSLGNRVDQTTLTGFTQNSDARFSFSFANGHVFINDNASIKAFQVVSASAVPEPAAAGVLALLGAALGFRRRR